jgi:hypothetical protein
VENYTMAGCTSLVKLVLTPQKRSTTWPSHVHQDTIK